MWRKGRWLPVKNHLSIEAEVENEFLLGHRRLGMAEPINESNDKCTIDTLQLADLLYPLNNDLGVYLKSAIFKDPGSNAFTDLRMPTDEQYLTATPASD